MPVGSSRFRHPWRLALIALPLAVAVCKGDKVVGPPATVSRIAFSSCGGSDCDIYVVGSDGSGLHQLTLGAGIDLQPRYSPDGSKVVFARGPDGQRDIYVMKSDGSNIQRLTSDPANDEAPAWSPDGTKIVFTSTRQGVAIWVMNADGSSPVRITTNLGFNPVWSPDGTKIAFNSAINGLVQIYTMRPDGTGITRISDGTRNDVAPAWSKDGSKIAFHSDAPGMRNDVFVMNADGTGRTQITHNTNADSYQPAWSPDGTRFAFVTNTTTDSNIYTMKIDGTDVRKLTSTGGAKVLPSWKS